MATWKKLFANLPTTPPVSAAQMLAPVPRETVASATILLAPAPAPTLQGESLKEYARVAEELGFAPAALSAERFVAFLAEECISVYDRRKVAAHLDRELGTSWCWRPMRKADKGVLAGTTDPAWVQAQISMQNLQQMQGLLPGQAQTQQVWTSSLQSNAIVRHLTPYQKAIPLPVLLTAKKIVTAFPDAKLFVSDLVAEHEKPRNPDPFLLVEYAEQTWIVEKWDEPKFRG